MEGSWDAFLDASFIIQIAKQGKDPTSFVSYGPIALLSVFYKLLSKLILNRLKDPLDTFIAPCQSGFRRAQSTNDPIFIARRLIDHAEWHGD
eukprot:2036393-Amphidinium_carterae.2